MTRARALSALGRADLLALPAAVDLSTACRALGIGETLGRELVTRGDFPVPVLRLGRLYRVTSASLLELLGITPQTAKAGLASPATATTTDDTRGRQDDISIARPTRSVVA